VLDHCSKKLPSNDYRDAKNEFVEIRVSKTGATRAYCAWHRTPGGGKAATFGRVCAMPWQPHLVRVVVLVVVYSNPLLQLPL